MGCSVRRYVRLGRWHDAVTSSQAAVAVDARDARLCQAAYFPEHNAQMLVYAANMGGEVSRQLACLFMLRLRLCWRLGMCLCFDRSKTTWG